jgi:hypothetical protein
MVKSTRRFLPTAAVIVALAGLGSCNLGVGIFPDRLMSYEAYVDLSGSIDEDRVFGFDFQIIRNPATGTEYLVLVNDDLSFDGVHLVVYDTDLGVLGSYTLAQLNAMDSVTLTTFRGRNAMVDASGMIVVGNRRFTVASTGLAYADAPSIMPGYNGLAVPEASEPNYHNFRVSGSGTISLMYDKSSLDWTTATGQTIGVGSGTVGKFVGAWMHNNLVYMMIHTDFNDMRVYQGLRTDFVAGSGSLTMFPSFLPVVTSSTAWQTLGFTYDGTVASFAVFCWMDSSGQKNRYKRFSVDGTLLLTSEEIPEEERPYEGRHVYGRESGWYIFDPKRMVIERRAWWWR